MSLIEEQFTVKMTQTDEGLFTQKKSEKSEKYSKNPRIFLRIYNPYTLFGSEQPLDLNPFIFINSLDKKSKKSVKIRKIQKIRKNSRKPEKIEKNSRKSAKIRKTPQKSKDSRKSEKH